MNSRTVDIVEGPLVEPITLAEAKAHCNVEIDADDDLIGVLISAARDVCESFTSRAFISQTISLTLDGFPFGGGYWNRAVRANPNIYNFLPTRAGEFILPRPPTQSIVSIEYLDPNAISRTLDPSVYRLVKGSLAASKLVTAPNQLWPITYPQPGSVVITLRAGYGDDPSAVPATAKAAMKLLIGHWYNNRDAVASGLSEVPMTVNWLLNPLCWAG